MEIFGRNRNRRCSEPMFFPGIETKHTDDVKTNLYQLFYGEKSPGASRDENVQDKQCSDSTFSEENRNRLEIPQTNRNEVRRNEKFCAQDANELWSTRNKRLSGPSDRNRRCPGTRGSHRFGTRLHGYLGSRGTYNNNGKIVCASEVPTE